MGQNEQLQVCVTVHEAKELKGQHISPVVCIQIDKNKQSTSSRENTTAPFYNEYFVFDFNIPLDKLLEKVIVISVLNQKSLIKVMKKKTLLGLAKMDIGSVWAEKDHQIYHKWAVIRGDVDMGAGPQGYVKLDISVVRKGESVSAPPLTEIDEDIQKNLLGLQGTAEDQRLARYIVKVYRADGIPDPGSAFPSLRTGGGNSRELVDPYVRVTFGDLVGKTKVKNNTCSPEWNQGIVFTELFPPMYQRFKIELLDSDLGKDTVIGTHCIAIPSISSRDDADGFPPTFGPAYVCLYDPLVEDSPGSSSKGSSGNIISYRGRILLAIDTKFPGGNERTGAKAEVQDTKSITQHLYYKLRSYLLFATIFEVSKIDKKVADKSIFFQITIGPSEAEEDEENPDLDTTPPVKTGSLTEKNYYLELRERKPCMYICSSWPDNRSRLYQSNVLSKILEKLEDDLHMVQCSLDKEEGEVADKLASVLQKFSRIFSQFKTARPPPPLGETSLKTALDINRKRGCEKTMEYLSTVTTQLLGGLSPENLLQSFSKAKEMLRSLKKIIEDPQHTIPDVFLCMSSGSRRVAYRRIPAREILFSPYKLESGRDCGKVQTMHLKPTRKGTSAWTIPAKVTFYMWLGLRSDSPHCLSGLPSGSIAEFKGKQKSTPKLPAVLKYPEVHVYQMNAYMYHATIRPGLDRSGLADPYVEVSVGPHSKTTEVEEETLNPTWNQTLTFNRIEINGSVQFVQENPPVVTLHVFDADLVGKDEFIGRTSVLPQVKAAGEPYEKPRFPAPLQLREIYNENGSLTGELLAAFELLQINDKDIKNIPKADITSNAVIPLPKEIQLTMAKYRLEFLFWGIRDLKSATIFGTIKPQVIVDCLGRISKSSVIQDMKNFPNFKPSVSFVDVTLPEDELFFPAIIIKVVDNRNTKNPALIGTHTIKNPLRFRYNPLTNEERAKILSQELPLEVISDTRKPVPSSLASKKSGEILVRASGKEVIRKVSTKEKEEKKPFLEMLLDYCRNFFSCRDTVRKMEVKVQKFSERDLLVTPDQQEGSNAKQEEFDWWCKFHEALETAHLEFKMQKESRFVLESERLNRESKTSGKTSSALPLGAKFGNYQPPITIYTSELEKQIEFGGFQDLLRSYKLFYGKTKEDFENTAVAGIFKGSFKLYRWPPEKGMRYVTPQGYDLQKGLFQATPSNSEVRVLLRVYIVKGTNLHPQDMDRKSDPYVALAVGSNKVSDREGYVPNQLNPLFGRCFEMNIEFPRDHLLTVQIWDRDVATRDDLIGETQIDLEDRFFSRHRATCGLATKYERKGNNAWKDGNNPTEILEELCKRYRIDSPSYSDREVRVGGLRFRLTGNRTDIKEQLALVALHRWRYVPLVGRQLLPEHVETRSLFNPKMPGLEQGKVEMWVDMFPLGGPKPGPKVDISPRKPEGYEMRVVIWNTVEVHLVDDNFFTGEKMSDLYVKGWLIGGEDEQSTDIHYRSLNGEGNFNWRFIFPFDYLRSEQKIIVHKKETIFSTEKTEQKLRPILQLQVWDKDVISADDFIGSLYLDLRKFPRGAPSSYACTLRMLMKDENAAVVDFFKRRKQRGWWPFSKVDPVTGDVELTGKVEAEFTLLTKEEAITHPVGHGRDPPHPLEAPSRPDESFNAMLSPIKTMYHVVWKNYRKYVFTWCILITLFLMLLVTLYTLPTVLLEKIIGKFI